MFLGHFAVAYGAKAAVPRTSLGTLFLAAQFVDLLWPILLLLDIEHAAVRPGITTVTPLEFISYPISHSLLMVAVWGLLFGAICWLVGKDVRATVVLGLCVVSHWVLDAVVHRPDLPIVPEGTGMIGLGLWNSLPGTLVVEASLLVLGVTVYTQITRSAGRLGAMLHWSLVGVLVLIYAANVFGPPPPDISTVAWAGQAQWLLVAWAYWADHRRRYVGLSHTAA